MDKSAWSAVICQPGGRKQNHDMKKQLFQDPTGEIVKTWVS